MKKLNMRMSSFIFGVLMLLSGSGAVYAQAFKLNSVSDLKRVFEDGYNLPSMQDTIKLFGIRGEVISGQCALQAKKDLTGVTVIVGPLVDKKSGTRLPEKSIGWNFVGSIPLTQNTPNQPLKAVVRKAPAKFPDYLMQEKQTDVKGKSFQAVWLTIDIPEAAAPATYSGEITVTSQQGEAKLPVTVIVYPLTLPETRHLKVTEWYTTDDFGRFHGINERYSPAWFSMLGKYAENMASHRQNIFQVPMEAIEIQKTTDGKLTFNFSSFDQIAQVFWDTRKMDFLETGELTRFGNNAWFSSDIKLQDFGGKTAGTGKTEHMAGGEVAPSLLPATASHLRQKGWLS